MTPDPSILLRAFRREALSDELFGAGLQSGASPLLMSRLAEGLMQLLLRHEVLPGLARDLRPRQTDILRSIARLLAARNAPVPPEVAHGLAEARAPGARDVEIFERLGDGIAVGVRALSAGKEARSADAAAIADICQLTCQIERDWHVATERALVELRNDSAAVPAAPPLPAPTEAQLTAYFREIFPDDAEIEIKHVERMVGDNSKDVFFFELVRLRGQDGRYVLRREPAYNATQASLADECELLKYLQPSGVPVPRVIGAEADGSRFGGGFIILARVPGAPRPISSYGPHARAIMEEFARLAALIHAVEIPTHLPRFADAALPPQDRMLGQIENVYQRWAAERVRESPLIEAAYSWLRRNVDSIADATVLVHSDFSPRNVLLDGDRVSAVLDWELSHAGHPAEDLAYVRPYVEAVMPWDDFMAAYHAHAKHRVSDAALHYFVVWCNFWQVLLSDAIYGGYCRNTHRNFIFASSSYVEARDRSDLLAKALAGG